MLQSLTGILDVLPGFDSLTIRGLSVTFGKCPASVLSVMADAQVWDLLIKNSEYDQEILQSQTCHILNFR